MGVFSKVSSPKCPHEEGRVMTFCVPEEVSPMGLCLGKQTGCSDTALHPGDGRECVCMGHAF